MEGGEEGGGDDERRGKNRVVVEVVLDREEARWGRCCLLFSSSWEVRLVTVVSGFVDSQERCGEDY